MNIWDMDGTPVIPVNTVGTMGAGLAKQAADIYPGLVTVYNRALKYGTLDIGKPFLAVAGSFGSDRDIALFATKTDWRLPSQYSYIQDGFFAMSQHWWYAGEGQILVPPLGCGLGGLQKGKVKQIFDFILGGFPQFEWVDGSAYETTR